MSNVDIKSLFNLLNVVSQNGEGKTEEEIYGVLDIGDPTGSYVFF